MSADERRARFLLHLVVDHGLTFEAAVRMDARSEAELAGLANDVVTDAHVDIVAKAMWESALEAPVVGKGRFS